ncbi:MAG: trigger factor [Gammaproteobacteria bacterium]|nr:trigger factor [Gammaproteobacteria bacterium]
MQVSVETTRGLERRMRVQVPAERVERAVTERLKSFSKRAKINGFRPGKIPLDVVKQRFGDQVRQEVLGDLLRDSCNEAFVQQKLNPAGGPRIDSVTDIPGKDLEFTATFEVYPEVKLHALDGIKVQRPVAEVADADLHAMVDNLRQQRASWESISRGARKGDRVQVDFEGSIDGDAFPGSKGEKTFVVLGENRMLEDFEKGLDGVCAGENREFEVLFPDDYHVKEVAGKSAHFRVIVHRVDEQRLPELDETFCKSFGITEGGIEKLRAEVAANMRSEMADNVRRRMKDQVLDALLAANPVDLPATLVDEEVERLRQDALVRIGVKDSNKGVELPRELFEEQAKRRVSLGLIIGEIISQQQFKVDEQRVTARLEHMANDYSNPAEAVRSMRTNPGVMRQLETLVLEDQAVDWLLDKAMVTDKPTTFRELMHFHEHENDHAGTKQRGPGIHESNV